MSGTSFSFRLFACTTAITLLTVGPVNAASGTWSGAADAFWTNSLNWSAAPYPSGGDTAVFSNASAFASLDVAGLAGILNITFDTASVAAYTIGTGAANSQTTILRDNGEIKLGSAAGASQTFNSNVRLGPDTANAGYSLRNDTASQTLTFNNISGMSGGGKALNINGIGPISVLGILDKGGSTLDVYDKLNSTLTINGNSSMRILQIEGTNSVINLGSGATMTVSNGGGSTIMASQNCTINGPGSI